MQSYSQDGKNVQIPDFMKKDLTKLKLTDNPQGKINVLSKIRNSTYYLICRSIKFGFSVSQLVENCKLTQKLIKDLQCFKDNQHLFQNML
jgi:hypothetical protein